MAFWIVSVEIRRELRESIKNHALWAYLRGYSELHSLPPLPPKIYLSRDKKMQNGRYAYRPKDKSRATK